MQKILIEAIEIKKILHLRLTHPKYFRDSLTQGPPAEQCAGTEEMRQLKIN
jgi:hypothetical protein